MHLLFTIEHTFMITGRGLVVTPAFTDKYEVFEGKRLRTGDKIRLIRPDKTIIQTRVTGMTFGRPYDLLVESHLGKQDVPIGTEVWLIEEDTQL